jgi:hypothetical protein
MKLFFRLTGTDCLNIYLIFWFIKHLPSGTGSNVDNPGVLYHLPVLDHLKYQLIKIPVRVQSSIHTYEPDTATIRNSFLQF